MRMIFFSLLTILISSVSFASTTSFTCSATAPRGTVTMVVNDDILIGQNIDLRFEVQNRNQTYVGSVTIVASQDMLFAAQGEVQAYEQNPYIHVRLTGSLDLNSNDTQTLVLTSIDDTKNRIDQGFGNILRCVKN